MIQLQVKAPFAVCRQFVAGYYRPSAPFLTPSAAYGLLLHLAGIDSRTLADNKEQIPRLEIAIGLLQLPESSVLAQQLHNYPIGDTGKEYRPKCKGNKYNIQPIRREILVELEAWLCVRADKDFEAAIRESLTLGLAQNQANGQPRYGIPFIGDNNFMVDCLSEKPVREPIHWLYKVDLSQIEPYALPPLYRMTTTIDRTDMTRTKTGLYALTSEPSLEPPILAWTMLEAEMAC